MSFRRGQEPGGLLVLGVLALAAQAAAPPARLTQEQKAKLAERDRLEGRLPGLLQKRQYDKALTAAERIAALEEEVLGETNLRAILSLERLAGWREVLERFPEAIAARRKVLRLQQRRLGKGHWQVTNARLALEHTRLLADMSTQQRADLRQAGAWNRQMVQLYRQGQPREALANALRVLEVRRTVLGERHHHYVNSLSWLALVYQAMGEHKKALPLFQEARERCRTVLGERHPDYANSLNTLAGVYQDLGEHHKALPLCLEARDLRRRVLGEKHPDNALSLNNLADLYMAMGEHQKALPLFLEARDLRRRVLGEKHADYAQSLNNLAALYQALGEYQKALPLLLEARDLYRKVRGEKHPHYALSLNSLALLYQARGEHRQALALFQEARELFRKVLGEKHPSYATSLSNLAGLYKDMGEHGKALSLYLEARELFRKVLQERHPNYGACLSSLAALYQDLGEHQKALPLLLEARELLRKTLGEKHPHYATGVSNLAVLYSALQEHQKALPLLLEARRLYRTVLGEKHPHHLACLDNLASLYSALREHRKALTLCLEARELRRKVQGEKHPHYAHSLSRLALLYQAMGEHGKALPLLLEARELFRTALGGKHPRYAASLNNLALLHQAMGKLPEALASSEEALKVLEAYLDDSFDLLGEQQRTGLLQTVLHNLGILLSLQGQAGEPAARRYSAVLGWKGRVATRGRLDRLARELPELKEPLRRLQEVRGRLARLGLQTPPPARRAGWVKQLQALGDQKQRLEADLSGRSVRFRRDGKRLTPEQLSKELPEGVAFIDLVEYAHYSPPQGGKGLAPPDWRLLAFVLRRGTPPVAVPLGAMKPLAQAVTRWRAEVEKDPSRANRQAIATAGQELRRAIWAPLTRRLGGAKTVIVAPDGVLCQFPLAALPGGKAGSYLLEEVAFAQVASARQLLELLRPAEKPASRGRGLLAVGGVDYGKGAAYPALPGTAPEARRCRTLFHNAFPSEPAATLSGREATVGAVRRELAGKRPRYLHLATHGFFEPAERVERLLEGLRARADGVALWREQTTTLAGLPLLRCGLALAGANQPPPPDDPTALPGVLTGQDVEELDLRGCELAVLSACQTALGDLTRSQGVLGLQRSFHAAGVKAMVTSLWSVHDAATLELMDEFYSRLWGKQKVSRLEALRQAQLAILRDPQRVRRRTEALLAEARKRGVPEATLRGIGRLALDLPGGGKVKEAPKRSPEAWWAAFVLSGDWR
jgi:CHAT domain-containing protein